MLQVFTQTQGQVLNLLAQTCSLTQTLGLMLGKVTVFGWSNDHNVVCMNCLEILRFVSKKFEKCTLLNVRGIHDTLLIYDTLPLCVCVGGGSKNYKKIVKN